VLMLSVVFVVVVLIGSNVTFSFEGIVSVDAISDNEKGKLCQYTI